MQHIREIMDEIFGVENFVSLIAFQETGYKRTNYLQNVSDYILWRATNKKTIRVKKMFLPKTKINLDNNANRYNQIEISDGTRRHLSKEEKENRSLIPSDSQVLSIN